MLNAYIYDGLRSPFGRYAGALAKVRPDDLLGAVIRAVMQRSPFKPESIEDIVVGCANQGGEDSRCVARHAGLAAGLPIEIPGTVLQRNCASGLGSIAHAAHSISAGEGEVFITGGVESMSRAPFVFNKVDSAFGRDIKMFDSTIGPRFSNPKLVKLYGDDQMPQTADNLAKEYGITREEADRFSAASQTKYAAAKRDKFFDGEISPYSIAQRKGDPVVVSEDEHPRPKSDMAALAAMKTLYEGGVVTAGNASGVNDGAAALIVGSLGVGEKAGVKPMVRVIASASAGVLPRIMGIGPVPASQKAMARVGLSIKDMDVIEINEAFAVQVLSCLKGLGVAFDDSRVNPNGGAIAIGHPLGASGARLALTAARQLQRSGGRYALVSLCIGGGQGMAVVLERV
jgi:acetyl-CoA C-acetyltransferase